MKNIDFVRLFCLALIGVTSIRDWQIATALTVMYVGLIMVALQQSNVFEFDVQIGSSFINTYILVDVTALFIGLLLGGIICMLDIHTLFYF